MSAAAAAESAAKATERSALEVEKAAIMLQLDTPAMIDSIEASSQVSRHVRHTMGGYIQSILGFDVATVG